ncbi:Spermatogenesis-associated protein 2 [Dissostichus eleginoides]|uniref:Spermatogenesis-associated protein 2 n=1 Tax=Dissostichus eleginoides TaxID=100907 RepID=A0AAD9CNI4_DISEL|nr:Spermatogenesis-associated protein 2 [Dissostichus eleginoides]
MKDGGREDPVSRHEVFEDYVNFFFQQCPEVGPCRDPPLLRRAARYLQTGEPAETFPLLPVHRTVLQGCAAPGSDCRKHLSAVSKAAELLETLCVNLFLQPWKKEIRTLKTYTGPFVYHLLPVLGSSTIQSVLASIGYLPHTDTAPR